MILTTKAHKPWAHLILAHGAGAGMNSDFMQLTALSLAANGIQVSRFDFAYMQLATQLGKRRPPDRMEKLLACYQQVLKDNTDKLPLFIGGKSMGGRVASMLVQSSSVLAGVCFGYPFHPAGKPDKIRTEHLYGIDKPMLIIQGTRDTLGNQQEIGHYALPRNIQLSYLTDGDHSFKPRKISGFTFDQHFEQAMHTTTIFIKQHIPSNFNMDKQ
ncbi:MAG: putative alpha/beta-hydrolase family hydrolase [Paraglaciecola sp.]|jgi:predicted alpha/beta-hydrolase family hydrolase